MKIESYPDCWNYQVDKVDVSYVRLKFWKINSKNICLKIL